MLVSSLIPQNDVEELGKLPALFRHYRFHAQPAQGGLSLGQFLVQHYGAGAASGADSWCLSRAAQVRRPRSVHDGLPLQGQHNVPPLVYLVPAAHLGLPAVRSYWGHQRHPQLAQARYVEGHSPALLQPPRV